MKTQKLSLRLINQMDKVSHGHNLPVIVQLKPQTRDVKALSLEFPFQRQFSTIPAAAMRATRQDIARLSEDPRVEKVWWDCPVRACLDASVPLLGTAELWQSGLDGAGVVVAVVDTGIDVNHADLQGKVAFTHDVTGEGFFDYSGHGTHVAGIIAGRGARYRGVAPGATLMGVKVLKGDGSGTMSGVMEGVEWAVKRKVNVINLSLGSAGTNDGSDPLSQVCDAAVSAGIVVCAAAGNEGPGRGTVGSPGAAKQVITVGASTDQDEVADFSSRGPTADDRVKPDILFPGYGIVSLRARGTSMGRTVDGLYTEASGTSMATPHAAGAVALLLQAKPALPPHQIKQILRATAKSLSLPPNTQGAGRADLAAARRLALSLTPEPAPSPQPTTPSRSGCLVAPARLAGIFRTG